MTPINHSQRRHSGGDRLESLQALLAEYAAAEARGQDAAALYPTVAALLQADPELREALEGLRAALRELYDGEDESPATSPTPDLSFLRVPAPAGTPPAREGMRELIVHFTESLLRLLRPREPVRGEQKARGQRLYRYHEEAGSPEEIELTVEIFAEGEERVAVSVVALDLRRDVFSQGGNRVRLGWGDQTVEGETDAAGYLVFSDVPESALTELVVVARVE